MILKILAVFGFMVAVGIGAVAMGELLARASARSRPINQEEKVG